MIVTKIEPLRRDARRVNLYLDGALAFGVHRDILLRQKIGEGTEITAPALEQLRQLEEGALAGERATKLLHHRLRSEHELRNRLLQEEFSPAAVAAALEGLAALGYIDDERFARAFIHDRLLKRSVGKVRLANELRRKGLPGSLIATVLADEVPDADETRRAEAEGAKALRRYHSRGDAVMRRERLTRFLVGRGFGWDAVTAAVKHLTGAG